MAALAAASHGLTFQLDSLYICTLCPAGPLIGIGLLRNSYVTNIFALYLLSYFDTIIIDV